MKRFRIFNLRKLLQRNSYAETNLSSRRCMTIGPGAERLWSVYKERKDHVEGKQLTTCVDPKAIFANNETRLQDIDVYGFDYDYTLAYYKEELHPLIYEQGRDVLVKHLKYPDAILKIDYDPHFAVRGLHFDVRKGLLMKIDSYHNIQFGTVYRGKQPVSDDEVVALYEGTHVPLNYMNSFYGTGEMHQLVDLFAPPEMTLISNVIEFFNQNLIPFDPECVFYDIRGAVQSIHSSGLLHSTIIENIDRYLERGTKLLSMLEQLQAANKKLFLITNSGFSFVDAGMKYLTTPDWMDLFDVVITNARKPKFFNETNRPFRIYDVENRNQAWDHVSRLSKGKVYQQGNLYSFRQMTGWLSSKVLYFGDHVYSDLADPSMKHGWKTAAIIPELEIEISKLNTENYKFAVRWTIALQNLVEEMQLYTDPDSLAVLEEWQKERDHLRSVTKSNFNPRFGSLFRTHHNPTYFSRRMSRFADLYMSRVTNLMKYSVNHTFYPRRMALPHEAYPRF